MLGAAGRVGAAVRVSGAPHDVAFVARRPILWISAEAAGRRVALDPRTGRSLRTIPARGRPHDVAVSPDGQRLWVTIDGSDAVEIRDAVSGRLLRRATLGGAPHDVAFAPGGRQVWLSNVGSPLLTLATASGRRLAVLRVGREPRHFAFGLGRLWASDNGGGALLRIGPGGGGSSDARWSAPHLTTSPSPDVMSSWSSTAPATSPSSRPRDACATSSESARARTASTRCPATDRSKRGASAPAGRRSSPAARPGTSSARLLLIPMRGNLADLHPAALAPSRVVDQRRDREHDEKDRHTEERRRQGPATDHSNLRGHL